MNLGVLCVFPTRIPRNDLTRIIPDRVVSSFVHSYKSPDSEIIILFGGKGICLYFCFRCLKLFIFSEILINRILYLISAASAVGAPL